MHTCKQVHETRRAQKCHHVINNSNKLRKDSYILHCPQILIRQSHAYSMLTKHIHKHCYCATRGLSVSAADFTDSSANIKHGAQVHCRFTLIIVSLVRKYSPSFISGENKLTVRSASKNRSFPGDVSLKSLSGLHLKLFYVTFSFFKLLSHVLNNCCYSCAQQLGSVWPWKPQSRVDEPSSVVGWLLFFSMIIDIILLGGQIFYCDKGVKKWYLWMVGSKPRYQSWPHLGNLLHLFNFLISSGANLIITASLAQRRPFPFSANVAADA